MFSIEDNAQGDARGVLHLAKKKTQPVKQVGNWVYRL